MIILKSRTKKFYNIGPRTGSKFSINVYPYIDYASNKVL
jgi:hypothetical protein